MSAARAAEDSAGSEAEPRRIGRAGDSGPGGSDDGDGVAATTGGAAATRGGKEVCGREEDCGLDDREEDCEVKDESGVGVKGNWLRVSRTWEPKRAGVRSRSSM